MQDDHPAGADLAPWRHGDVPAMAAYLRKRVTGLEPRDEIDRRNICRIFVIETIDHIQYDPSLNSAAKNRGSRTVLDAYRQIIDGAA